MGATSVAPFFFVSDYPRSFALAVHMSGPIWAGNILLPEKAKLSTFW